MGAAEPLVDLFSKMGGAGVNLAAGWQYAAIVFAIIAVIFFYLCFSWTKERIKPVIEKTSLKDDFKDLWHNRPWFILLGAGISVIFFNSIRDGAAIYYFKYYVTVQDAFQVNSLNMTISLSSLYFVLGQAANIVGVLLTIPVSNRMGKKGTFLVAMIIATVLNVWFYYVDRSNVSLIFVLQFFISLCAGITLPLIWSMYADASDYSEWKTKRRATGLVFSASSMSQKFGWTIGGALTGWLLGYYGFQANMVQSEFAQNGIRMMLSYFPAIGTILGVLFMLIYPLGEKKMAEISACLRVERGETDDDKEQ